MPTALWTGLVNDVYTLTNRPGLVAETILALKQATLRAHLIDLFPRDLVVSTYIDPSAESQTSLTVAVTAIPLARFRTVNMIKVLDVDSVALDAPTVELVELNDIFEPGYPGLKRPSIAWLAGSNINVYCTFGLYGIEVQWFQSPVLDPDNYVSWIAEMFPDVIVWAAARTVWNRSGNEAKAKEASALLGDLPPINFQYGLYHDLRANFMTIAGR